MKTLFSSVFGLRLNDEDYFMQFDARLDESGTDGTSSYTILAGSVATVEQWEIIEKKWADRLEVNNVSAYHAKEFNNREGDFKGWSDFKRNRFKSSLLKILNNNTVCQAAIAVDQKAHAEIKKKMTGVKGFSPDSDYSLALRFLMFIACGNLIELDKNAKLSVIVEDGPWSSGAYEVYQSVRNARGGHRPAKYAHMLNGFTAFPKGVLKGLEAADFIADRAIRDLDERSDIYRDRQISFIADGDILEQWYQGMLSEKEARRLYYKERSMQKVS